MANQGEVTEYVVRVPPRNEKKHYHMMKFRSALNHNDPSKWTGVRMIRENNKKQYKGNEEEMPKFGAGSEYGREEREEARRKKYGYNRKVYDADMQPWLMRIGGKKDGKHYRGQREGGVSENTTFYVFTHAPDGSFEAQPIKEWYNFVPRVAYRTLDCDEAEEKFAERGKILNLWATQLNKKLKPDQGGDDDDLDDEDGKKGKKKGGKKTDTSFKIHDGDDFGGSGDESFGDDSDEEEDKKKKKSNADSDDEGGAKKKGGKGGKKKKSKEDVNDEAFEDSDDGEGEGREVDYMSDESSEEEGVEEAKHDIHGVEADEGLSKMLDSDESDEEDEEKKEKNEEEESNDKNGKKEEGGGSGKKSTKSSANNSRSGSPSPDSKEAEAGGEKNAKAEKRKAIVDKLLDPNAGDSASKRGRFEAGPATTQPATNSIEASFEEDVRRYLARKPMTTTEILRKMTQKRPGFPKEDIMPLLVNILKRINPHKQKIKGQMYLTIKTGN